MIPVKSSNLAAVGKCAELTLAGEPEDLPNLLVEFTNGKVAEYRHASFHLESLLEAQSAGKYFIAFIKDRYPWRYVNAWSPVCEACGDSGRLADGTACSGNSHHREPGADAAGVGRQEPPFPEPPHDGP